MIQRLIHILYYILMYRLFHSRLIEFQRIWKDGDSDAGREKFSLGYFFSPCISIWMSVSSFFFNPIWVKVSFKHTAYCLFSYDRLLNYWNHYKKKTTANRINIHWSISMERISRIWSSVYPSTAEYKWLLLTSYRTYTTIMHRNFFAQYDAAKRHPNINATLCGVGFDGQFFTILLTMLALKKFAWQVVGARHLFVYPIRTRLGKMLMFMSILDTHCSIIHSNKQERMQPYFVEWKLS